jgi:1-acyl-sn-glycerol-3-phosphate acyltransferase
MGFTYHAVNFTFKHIVRLLCRVDDSQWVKIPARGPLILAVNHINFIEMPIMVTHLIPRPITGLVKSDGWQNPFLRWVFTLWGAIPLQRGQADMSAVRAGLAALNEGKILAIAPEGKRTGDGRLIEGHPGIVTMALKSQAPILPVVYYGNEHFWPNFKRLRRTDFKVNVGCPFILNGHGRPVSKQMRRQMTAEIMFQLARLLPEQNRGYYADLSAASEEFLDFQVGQEAVAQL